MPRRSHSEVEHESHERWLVSYADFITLLFAFFVVMYAVSSVSEGKYRVLSNSLVQAFRNVTVNATGVQMMVQTGVPTVPQTVSMYRASKVEDQKRVAREKLRTMAGEISAAMAPLVREGHVRVKETAQGVSVEINASVLFSPGDARLDLAAVKTLRAVALILASTDFPVTVEGHTDVTPISTPQFPSNWELSVVRASSVVRLFIEAGVNPQHMTAAGYGEQRPVAANDTAEGRARNRRVAILIESPTYDLPEEIPIGPRNPTAAAGNSSRALPDAG